MATKKYSIVDLLDGKRYRSDSRNSSCGASTRNKIHRCVMSEQSKEDAAWLAHCKAERQRINELIRQMVGTADSVQRPTVTVAVVGVRRPVASS